MNEDGKRAIETISNIMRHGSNELAAIAKAKKKERQRRVAEIHEAISSHASMTCDLDDCVLKDTLTEEEFDQYRWDQMIDAIKSAKTNKDDREETRKLVNDILQGRWHGLK